MEINIYQVQYFHIMWFKSIQSWTWYILYCVLCYILCQWSENDWVWVCFVAIHILCLVYLWARFIDFLSRYLGWSGYNDNNWFCVIYWSSWPQKPTADFFDAVCHFVVISYLAYYIYKQFWSKFWPQKPMGQLCWWGLHPLHKVLINPAAFLPWVWLERTWLNLTLW